MPPLRHYGEPVSDLVRTADAYQSQWAMPTDEMGRAYSATGWAARSTRLLAWAGIGAPFQGYPTDRCFVVTTTGDPLTV